MARSAANPRRRRVLWLGLLALWPVASALRGAEETPWTARDLAAQVQVVAEPGFAFRYNSGRDPYGRSTESLLDQRRAYFPGERVTLTFRLPRGARVAGPLETRATFALHDLDGGKLHDLGDAAVRAEGNGVSGELVWTVPEAAEGSYLLAARFLAAAGQELTSRSEVVFIAPEYPRLLAAAAGVRIDPSVLSPLLREVSWPSTQMLVEDAQMRFHDFGHAPRDWRFVVRQLRTARDFAHQLAAGEDPWRDRTGLLVKAYRSEEDDTLQPYALYVPKDYDPRKAWPLVVSLHGATSNHLLNRRRVFGLGNRPGESDYEAIRNEDVTFPEVGMIVLSPYGRGEVAGYNGIAERDVLRAMADVKRAYHVDEDRVYLTGLSMGGGGTWHLGLRYPDLFAALAPVCAVGDISLFSAFAGLSSEAKALLDLTGPTAMAENAANQQVFIFHGDVDPVVVPEHSRRMAARYRELGWLGKSVFYFEQPGVNHFAWDFAYRDASIFARLAAVKRNPRPERVVYTTYSPRYNKAYWLRIDRIERGGQPARIEGTQQDGRFVIRSTNLSAFTLLLDPVLAPLGKVVSVDVNGRAAWKGLPRATTLSLERDRKGRWVEKPWTGPAVGPPDHAEANFLGGSLVERDTHVYVYGTAGDAATASASKRVAQKLADWGPDVRARFAVLADTEVTAELMASRSLVLVGNATVNQVVARLADRLPIRQDATGSFVGAQRLAGPEGAFRLVYPNPLAPGRYVRVLGAGTAEALARLLPAPGGFPIAPPADYQILNGQGQAVLEGYFKDDWTIGR